MWSTIAKSTREKYSLRTYMISYINELHSLLCPQGRQLHRWVHRYMLHAEFHHIGVRVGCGMPGTVNFYKILKYKSPAQAYLLYDSYGIFRVPGQFQRPLALKPYVGSEKGLEMQKWCGLFYTNTETNISRSPLESQVIVFIDVGVLQIFQPPNLWL